MQLLTALPFSYPAAYCDLASHFHGGTTIPAASRVQPRLGQPRGRLFRVITLFWVTLNGIALLRMKIFSARTSARDTVSGRHGICGGDLTEPTSLQPIPSAGRILGQYPGFRDKTSGRVHPADLSANRQWRPTAQDVVGTRHLRPIRRLRTG